MFVLVNRRRKLLFTIKSINKETMLRNAMMDIAPQEMDLTHTPVSPHSKAVQRIRRRPEVFWFLETFVIVIDLYNACQFVMVLDLSESGPDSKKADPDVFV